MFENRWLLFIFFFVGMMSLHLIFSPGSTTPIIEQIISTLISAAAMAYSFKYLKRLLAYLIQKIVPLIIGPKSRGE
jgi:hypothetical protein